MQQHCGHDGTHNSADKEPSEDTCPLCTLGVVAVIALSVFVAAYNADTDVQPVNQLRAAATPVHAPFDPNRFILNALLVPALETDAEPPRWVDPTDVAQCGPDNKVKVNGLKLAPGGLVPVAPFELAWSADECYPFGVAGPRFDGAVTLIVFPAEHGFDAMVEPAGMRVRFADRTSVPIRRGWASLPRHDDGRPATERFELAGE